MKMAARFANPVCALLADSAFAPRSNSPDNGRTAPFCYVIIPPMYVILLRLALALYSVGLLHSILTVFNRKPVLFKPAFVAVSAGLVCHTASIILRGIEVHYLPLTQ